MSYHGQQSTQAPAYDAAARKRSAASKRAASELERTILATCPELVSQGIFRLAGSLLWAVWVLDPATGRHYRVSSPEHWVSVLASIIGGR